jgi:starch-binding outer membrane protein, SusD/RagB family
MKKIFLKASMILACVSVIASYWGCKKSFLDRLPHGPTEQIFFSTEAEFTRAVYGIYAKMTDLYGWVTVDRNAGPDATLMPIYLLPGDDITTNNPNDPFEIFGPLQPSNGRVGQFYKTLYQLIARANVVLEKAAAVAPGIYQTPNLKTYHEGEAYFLRGFAYYYLWTYFGTAPLNTARVTSTEQFFPPSTTGTQLLDQAIQDFTKASTALPASWDNANRGRATKNSAFGFLGKSLMFRASATKNAADYTAAIAAINSITGAALVAKYDDNFAVDTENNSESLFEFQASQAAGENNIWLENDFDNNIGNLSISWNFYNGTELYGQSRFFATNKLLNSYEAGDPRRDLTLNPADRTIRKYVSRSGGAVLGYQNGGSIDNYRLLRYADALLLKAEALIQSNGSTLEAINLINQVRTRARGAGTSPANLSTAETNRTTIMNWIINERFVELAAEGQRWPDIRRWHLQGILTLNNAFFDSNTSAMSFSAPKHLLLPIPLIETDVNPNVKPNEGY